MDSSTSASHSTGRTVAEPEPKRNDALNGRPPTCTRIGTRRASAGLTTRVSHEASVSDPKTYARLREDLGEVLAY